MKGQQMRTRLGIAHGQAIKPGGFVPAGQGCIVQSKCTCGGSPGIDGECAQCRQKGLSLQRNADRQAASTAVPPIVHEVLHSPGQPLDPATRAFMEPRLGHDFSRVRVHTDMRAAESARAVNALAYTVGNDVVFGVGQYVPNSLPTLRLVAHELTHVVQQTGATDCGDSREIGPVNNPSEKEAAGVAEEVAKQSVGRPQATIGAAQQHLSGKSFKLQRKVVDDDTQVTCRPTRPGAVATLQTAENDAVSLGRLAALLARLHVASHPMVTVLGETPELAAFRDILWRRFHLDYNTARVRNTLVPIIARRLELAADWISRLNHRYRCGAPDTEPPGECTTRPGAGIAWSATGGFTTQLCESFWDESAEEQAGTILHEWLHVGFDFLGDCEAANFHNTVCYDIFARELIGTATAADYATCCAPPADPLPPLAGVP